MTFAEGHAHHGWVHHFEGGQSVRTTIEDHTRDEIAHIEVQRMPMRGASGQAGLAGH